MRSRFVRLIATVNLRLASSFPHTALDPLDDSQKPVSSPLAITIHYSQCPTARTASSPSRLMLWVPT
jgi:hypothetical protein